MESDAIGSSVDMGPWDSPGKNTGVGWHFLLQGIVPAQILKPESPAPAGGFFTSVPPGKQIETWHMLAP